MNTDPRPSPSVPRPIPTGGVARGTVLVPPSKSVTHRILALALLSGRPTIVERRLRAEDTDLFVDALATLGWAVEESGEELRLEPPSSPAAGGRIECGNAGTLFRFLVALLATVPGAWRLDGKPRLRERPVGGLTEALQALGVRFEFHERAGFAPLTVEGGSLRGGSVRLEARESSQYVSAILLAGLRASEPVELEVLSPVSAPYIDLTLAAIRRCGGRVRVGGPAAARRYWVEPGALVGGRRRVEGDYSAAAYPAAAAALTGGRVTLSGLERDSAQGDRGFLDLLGRMGASVEWRGEEVEITGSGRLRAQDVDFAAMPDQVPTLAAIAPFATGTSRITGVPHLRIKESDRLAVMARELRRAGVPVEELPDGLVVPGVWADVVPPTGRVVVDAEDDHRIAMSLSLTGLRRPGIEIADPQVVAKSYPEYWTDFERLVGG